MDARGNGEPEGGDVPPKHTLRSLHALGVSDLLPAIGRRLGTRPASPGHTPGGSSVFQVLSLGRVLDEKGSWCLPRPFVNTHSPVKEALG